MSTFTEEDMADLNYRLNNPTHVDPFDDGPGRWDTLLTTASTTLLIGGAALGLVIIVEQIIIAVNK